ncbi:cytochrome c-type biogenesis protein CcmH [Rhodobacter aestuarii]|uniref:Cytochrome c-type biogenesis protein CcmH n=1 Tax=Rhodobacter aestuarii TaxID=453582 RepID=A0A1N7J0T9_9RHOB|nr:c-type cytochrome biogenesis protein CcmI [Rhodobacter aestuarii]PTV97305.1 cytochrome c-type biogenesis protein CcmH [Rhodobacter aestuarii]SIS43002.1 cytochrome c-type biogenesis protein CcmH [Rhodobacter aestuarii]
MLFWIICATLVAAIAFALAITLLRPRGAEVPAAVQDMQVYRTQLAEVEKDRARGVLAPEEADRLKIEISRRLLEADRAAQAAMVQAGGQAPRGLTVAMAGIVVAALAGTFFLYDWLGANGMPDEPMAKRIAAANDSYTSRPSQEEAEKVALAERGPTPEVPQEFQELMERLRKAVQDRPNDIRGLDLLAVNEMQVGNYHAGWEAQRRLIALKGDSATAEDYARLGEFMFIAAGQGIITPETEAAFATALDKDRTNARALFYLGLMMGQNQRPDRAFRLWDAALRVSAPEDPWVPLIMQNIDALAWLAGEDDYTAPMPVPRGPTAEDLAAAQDMPPAERAQMVRGMVEALNARMANEGGTIDDWEKLISSLRIIGEAERAGAIAGEAREKFANRAEDLARIEAAAATPLGEKVEDPAPAAPMMPGPSAEQVQAAGEMSAEDRQAMIEGMVERLVTRLNEEGGSVEEWTRAIGALSTIGKTDEAKEMLAKARAALAEDAQALAALEAAAKSAGVSE